MQWNKPQGAWLLIALLLASAAAEAQFSHTTHNARSSAMGGVLLYDIENRHVALGYRQHYMVGGMADKTLCIVWPTGNTGTAMGAYRHYGNLDYHEQQAAGGYMVRVARWLHVGATLRYLHLGTSDGHYQARQWLAGSVTLLSQPGHNTRLSLTAGSRPWDAQRPYRWHLTMGYRPLPQLTTVVEAESEERMRLRLGMEYSYQDRLYARTGLSTHPLVLCFGMGMHQRHWAVDLAVDVHKVLGINPQTTLTLWF